MKTENIWIYVIFNLILERKVRQDESDAIISFS